MPSQSTKTVKPSTRKKAPAGEIDRRALIAAARAARKRAYAPYSHYQVGAAVLTRDGEAFTGCNVENAAYPACICAEQTATVKAVSEGHPRLQAVAIATGNVEGQYYAGFSVEGFQTVGQPVLTNVQIQVMIAGTGLPRSTTYHLLDTLVQEGFVVHVPEDHRYALGRRIRHRRCRCRRGSRTARRPYRRRYDRSVRCVRSHRHAPAR